MFNKISTILYFIAFHLQNYHWTPPPVHSLHFVWTCKNRTTNPAKKGNKLVVSRSQGHPRLSGMQLFTVFQNGDFAYSSSLLSLLLQSLLLLLSSSLSLLLLLLLLLLFLLLLLLMLLSFSLVLLSPPPHLPSPTPPQQRAHYQGCFRQC